MNGRSKRRFCAWAVLLFKKNLMFLKYLVRPSDEEGPVPWIQPDLMGKGHGVPEVPDSTSIVLQRCGVHLLGHLATSHGGKPANQVSTGRHSSAHPFTEDSQ